TAGTPTVGRAPVGIGAVMAPMPASAGAAATAGTAGSCRDTTAPRGSRTRTASGRSLKRRRSVSRRGACEPTAQRWRVGAAATIVPEAAAYPLRRTVRPETVPHNDACAPDADGLRAGSGPV